MQTTSRTEGQQCPRDVGVRLLRQPELNRCVMTLLTQREAAVALRLSERTLERSWVSGFGPPFCKLGRRVLYRADDLDQWIASRVVRSTSQRIAEGRTAR